MRIWLLLLVAVLALTAGGLPDFNTQTIANRFFIYDGNGTEITTGQVRAYVDNASDTSAAGSYYDCSYSDPGWTPDSLVDTTVVVNIYTIDTAIDTLRESGFVLVGQYAPKEWNHAVSFVAGSVTDDALADGIDGDKITDGSLPGSAIQNTTVGAEKLETGAALENLISAPNIVDLSHSDGAGALTDSLHLTVDTLTVYIDLTIDNLLVTEQPGVGTDGEVRVTGADFVTTGDVALGNGSSDTLGVWGPSRFHDVATFDDSLTVGAHGDTATTHPVTGFLRLASAIKNVTYPASVVTSTVDFDGATSDMVFLAWMPTSAATTNHFSATYLSPGKITVVASSTSPGTRAIVVLGFKR